MRRGKRIAYVLLAAALLTVSALPPMEIEAGNTEILLDEESLDTADWNNPEGDIVIEEGTLVFTEESTEYTRFITKTPVKIEETSDLLANFTASVKLNTMPQGGSFILAFGLSGIEAEQGEDGNIEVAFTNDGGIKAAVNFYEDGNATVLAGPANSGLALGRASKVTVEITTKSEIKVVVNGNTICSATLPVSGEGRFGFLQTGSCSAEVSDLEFAHYKYERPENTNVSEDFENGGMDISKLTAKMIWTAVNEPIGQYVTDYEGNQVLMHVNTGAAYIGTLYKYSNFEMTFDVPYLNVERVFNEDGSLQLSAFDKLQIAIGGEQPDWESVRVDLAAEVITLENGVLYSNSNREEHSATLTNNPFAEGKPFSMQVKMVDNILSVGMKWLEEENFQTLLEYKIKGGTPTGHIHIWAPQGATFAIDNLVINNLDHNANVIETEYKSGKIEVPEDNQLESLEKVYAEVKDTGLSWYLLIPATAIAGAVALAITVIATREKKKEREATQNEQ